MADSAQTRQALDAWTATLEHMQQNLAATLAKTAAPQSPLPIQEEEAARIPLGRLDRRLADWEARLQETENDVHAADAASREEIARLQSWTAPMAEAREKLAQAATRTV